MKNPKLIFLILSLAFSFIILLPFTSFQNLLSTGDHGRDFYAFEQALNGKKPYTDYWWVYGPLMPSFYALFYKFFGIKMASILWGKLFVQLLGAGFFYLSAQTIMPPLIACLTTLWFVSFMQDFFFTFNHAGGIAALLGAFWCVVSYGDRSRQSFLWIGAFLCFLLGLIKINFGIASSVAMAVCVFLMPRVPGDHFYLKRFYTTALFIVPAAVLFVHWLYLKDLPFYAIRQCMPYANADQPYNTSPILAVGLFLTHTFQNMRSNPINLAFGVIIILSALQTVILLLTKNPVIPAKAGIQLDPRFRGDDKHKLLLIVLIISIFYVFNFHEFLKSGVWYRGFWAQPFSIMLSFFLIHTATAALPRVVRGALYSVLAGIILISFSENYTRINSLKTPDRLIATDRGGIYVGNEPGWVATVNQTAAFLNQTLQKDDLFFALPYDCLYYYLTGKPSPTRQLIFFEHINIPPEQEQLIIAELESKKVNYVVLSNRFNAPLEAGLGLLGKTYCPLIGKYIEENFTPVARFGDWTNHPGWGWAHGTVILSRKQ